MKQRFNRPRADFKPHQRFKAPSPADGERVFYESLWTEKADKSPMAAAWMLEHGLLAGREVENALKAVQRAAK